MDSMDPKTMPTDQNTTLKSPKPRILIIDDNAAIHEDFRKILCPEAATAVLDKMEATLFEIGRAHV